MEAQAALVGAYGAVELHPVAGIGLDFPPVIHPGDTEGEDAVGLDHPLHYPGLLEFRMLVVDILYGFQYLLYRLEILALAGILGLETGHNVLCLHINYVC